MNQNIERCLEEGRPITLGDLNTDDKIGDALAEYFIACARGEHIHPVKMDRRPAEPVSETRRVPLPLADKYTRKPIRSWPPPPDITRQYRLRFAQSKSRGERRE